MDKQETANGMYLHALGTNTFAASKNNLTSGTNSPYTICSPSFSTRTLNVSPRKVDFLSSREADFEPLVISLPQDYQPYTPRVNYPRHAALPASPPAVASPSKFSSRSIPMTDFYPMRVSEVEFTIPSEFSSRSITMTGEPVSLKPSQSRFCNIESQGLNRGPYRVNRMLSSPYFCGRQTDGCSFPGTPMASSLNSHDASCTTFVLRNLPVKYTKSAMVQEIEDRGFLYHIDFLYLPFDPRRKHAAGYCFVNLTSQDAAAQFRNAFDGVILHGPENYDVCNVDNGRVQGLHANIELYRSRVTWNTDDDFQPSFFDKGKARPLSQIPQGSSKNRGVTSDFPLVEIAEATTLMLRGIPNKYTKNMLLEEFAERGVLLDIDFFYLPIDLRHKCNVGYCFVNVINKEAALDFFYAFEGTTLDEVKSNKVCQVTVGCRQGQEANIEHYRNTAVMTMQEEYRPVILKDGHLQSFPAPTLSLYELTRRAKQRSGVSSRSKTR